MMVVLALFVTLIGCVQAAWTGDFSVRTGRSTSFIRNPTDGAVWAMGRNNFLQLGVGTSNATEPLPVPVKLPSSEEVVDIAVGAFHSLFVFASGVAYSSGRNNFGQLGHLSEMTSPDPTKVDAVVEESDDPNVTTPTVVAVAAGYGHSLFLLSNGIVRGVGLNSQGQLGDGTDVSRTASDMVTLDVGEPVKAIAAGYDFSYFLTVSGNVFATGNNLGGQLGDGTRDARLSPVQVLSDVAAVSAGEAHGLFLKTDGTLMGTGANFDGQIGAAELYASTPVSISSMAVTAISAGGDSTAFVCEDDMLMGLGSNRFGQLGLGNVTMTSMEMQIKDSEGQETSGFKQAAVGASHSLFLSERDFIYSAGMNTYGELGDGTYESSAFLLEEIYGVLPVTKTSTGTETATTTEATVTVSKPGEVTATGTMTSTATTTHTRTREAAGTGGFGFGSAGSIAVIAVIASVALVALVLDIRLCCGRDSTPEASGQPEQPGPAGGEGDLELARAQMSI